MKIWKTLFFTMATVLGISSCSDVPEPYTVPGTSSVEGAIFKADFSNSLNNFTTVSGSGSLSWYNDFSSAMVTGYQDFNGDGTKENQAGVTYLISPEIDLTTVGESYLLLNMAINYERGDINNNNSVLITTNYTGDVLNTEWTQLNYNTDGLGSSFTFTDKGINIPSDFIGKKVYIALRHTCSESQSSTWEVKKMQILKGTYEEPTPEPEQPAEGEYLSQDFSSTLGSFTSVAATGSLSWYNDFSSAMVTGYQDFNNDGTKENQGGVTYLVSPAFTISGTEAAHIAINMAINYERADINTNNAILISKDYAGDVNTATWTQLTYNTDGLGSSFTFTDKQINIPAEFIGSPVVVAFRHTCNDTQSSTWEVKSIKVATGSAEEPSTTPDDPSTSVAGDAQITVDGTTVTLTNPKATPSATVTTTALNIFGWANQDAPTGAADSEGTSFVFAKESGRNDPLFYAATNGVRMYAKNSLTLQSSKPIAKVVFTCDSFDGTNYVGNPTLYATINGNEWKIINDHTAESGGVQLRIKSIEITYAE